MPILYSLTSRISKSFSINTKEIDINNSLSKTEGKSKLRKSKYASLVSTKIINVGSYKIYNQLNELSFEDIEHRHIRC